eukprot:scaffold3014_cov116-Cylindrotheca_fusiformis.AAC.6
MKFHLALLVASLPSLAIAKLGQTTRRAVKEDLSLSDMGYGTRSGRFLVEEHYPLGRCAGDCDSDDDCEGDLVCFQRDHYESVPGCSGGSSDGTRTDYCVEKGSGNSPKKPLRFEYPLGKCKGDCDSDSDCLGDLKCFHRDPYQSVPGCAGGSSDGSRTDFCYAEGSKNDKGVIDFVSTNPPEPLYICQGDCDSDFDCGDFLVCFQRDSNDEVPGCVGGSKDNSRTDYCIRAEDEPERSLKITHKDSSHDQFSLCEGKSCRPITTTRVYICLESILTKVTGDCDDDEDCRFGMVCFQRDPYESVPGCKGGSSDGSRTDYCVWDTAIYPWLG